MGGMVGGPTIERTSVLAGTTAWDDTQNRGGMGGGMHIVMRGPGDGPGPGGGAGPTPEQLNEARVRRMRVQLHRLQRRSSPKRERRGSMRASPNRRKARPTFSKPRKRPAARCASSSIRQRTCR